MIRLSACGFPRRQPVPVMVSNDLRSDDLSITLQPRRLRRTSLVAFASIVAIGNACSDSAEPDTTSTFSGTLAIDTFPGHPDAVLATNELGGIGQTPVSADGAFQIELERAHRYVLSVASDSDRINVVFPRTSGLTSEFAVASGAARVSLGTIRYLPSAPAQGFFLESARLMVDAASGSAAEFAQGAPGECVNGVIAGSGSICIDDAGDVACEGEASDGDGECQNGVDLTTGVACSDPPDISDGDGECENGVDTSTGLACDDPAETVDPLQPMAVAEHNVPDQVGGCDEGGGEEQDD